MVFVVERYLPGLSRTDLLSGLSKLEPAIAELCGEGTVVRYLGSTIVLGDEACFCEFDGPSAAAVAEANHRAGLPFDRIVPALLVDSHHRRGEMSVSTSVPQTARVVRSHRLVVIPVLAAVIAVVAWAIATYTVGSGSRSAQHAAPTQASVLSGLTPRAQQYVLGIVSLTPAQLAAAFGTVEPTGSGTSSLTPSERYAQAIAGMSRSQQAAAFGTDEPSTSGTSSSTPSERYAQAIAAMSRSQQAAAFGTGK